MFFALVCTGCDSQIDGSADGRRIEIDASDVAWATGWSIYKWRLGDLTSEPVRSIQIVVVGSDGEVIHEAGDLGYNELLDQDKHVTIAVKREVSSVLVHLRHGGITTSRTLNEIFGGVGWSSSPEFGMAGDLVAVATDAQQIPATTEALLKLPGNKLCLRFITQGTSEAEQGGAGQPATRSESR